MKAVLILVADMIKKISVILLSALMIISFFGGCKKKKNTDTQKKDISSEQKTDTIDVNESEDKGLVIDNFDPTKEPSKAEKTKSNVSKTDNSSKSSVSASSSPSSQPVSNSGSGESSDTNKESMDGWTPWR